MGDAQSAGDRRPERRSWLGLLGRGATAPVRSAVRALDSESIRRSWEWAQDNRRAATDRSSGGLPIVEDADGRVDLVASGERIRAYALAQFADGRSSEEVYHVMGYVTPEQVDQLLAWQDAERQKRIRALRGFAVSALISSFACLFFVVRVDAAIMSASFFMVLALYFGLQGMIVAREKRCNV